MNENFRDLMDELEISIHNLAKTKAMSAKLAHEKEVHDIEVESEGEFANLWDYNQNKMDKASEKMDDVLKSLAKRFHGLETKVRLMDKKLKDEMI